jgi:kynurenine formamidase
MITADLLAQFAPEINPGDALLIGTGWDQQWNKPGFVLDSPNLDRKALQWIIDKKIALLGVDLTCIEASWSEDDEEAKGGLLSSLFRTGALLLAPIVNVRRITQKEGILLALPMKLKGTSGAPVRAIFLE